MKKESPAPLAQRTKAAQAFMKAVDDLNAAVEECRAAGLRTFVRPTEDRCSPGTIYIGEFTTIAL